MPPSYVNIDSAPERDVGPAAMATAADLPSVGVVIATHQRPELMRRALASVLAQRYTGRIDVVLVFDREEPDTSLILREPGRTVRVQENVRSPGLAGARNSGILALRNDLVAFCDDDDLWVTEKLSAQVDRLLSRPDAEFLTTAMSVNFDGRTTTRLADRDQVTLADLTRSRMAMLHSSSFLFRRSAMLDGFGLVDERLPGSMAEDWDLLLRAARRRPIEHVDLPLVDIQWGQSSYFNNAWADKIAAHEWLIEHHPEIRKDRPGSALHYGKIAFGYAVLGDRQTASRYAWRCAKLNWREPRSLIALGVAAGVPGRWIQTLLNRRGHGI